MESTNMTTQEHEETHATPSTIEAWHDLAAEKIDPAMIRRLGPVNEGKEGRYATRRVFYLKSFHTEQEPLLASVQLVACDEPNEAAKRVRADGRSWWPYVCHGHYGGCGPKCTRHGDAWENGV